MYHCSCCLYSDENNSRVIKQVKNYLSDRSIVFMFKDLKEIYIKENSKYPSVIIILKITYAEYNYDYWDIITDNIRNLGILNVSVYPEDDELLKIDSGMTKFSF